MSQIVQLTNDDVYLLYYFIMNPRFDPLCLQYEFMKSKRIQTAEKVHIANASATAPSLPQNINVLDSPIPVTDDVDTSNAIANNENKLVDSNKYIIGFDEFLEGKNSL